MSRRYREDHFTNTVADAERYEAECAIDEYYDERPTLAELDRDEASA